MTMRTFLVLGLLLASAQADEIAALVAATKDPERGVRYAAVQALGKAGQGVEALVAALDDPEWCVRQAAGHSLARVRGPAVDALLKVAKEGKPDARVEAYEALRRMGWRCGPHVIPALEDEDARVVFEELT